VTTTEETPGRSAGLLLHPTSLLGPYGIGDLGPSARKWIDALARARQSWWQVLPLGPTGYGDSPYQSSSTFAGNPYLISPDLLVEDRLAEPADLEGVHFPADHVEFGPVIEFKVRLLAQAWQRFQAGAAPNLRQPFDAFCNQQAGWLDDFCLFSALKDAHGGAGWLDWPAELVRREPAALDRARRELRPTIGLHRFRQFLFFRQWKEVKAYANARGVRLIGDVPIFVSIDSSDVWANPQLYHLDEERRPTVVAGVPPDYFSATGQLWGNPLYDWEAMRRTGYSWWLARLRATLALVDVVRLDHFRGFESYWEVPADAETAATGRWVQGPGAALFEALRAGLGGLPLIAEDLGLITPEVEALRARLGLPGMRILQFAFGDTPANRYLPHHYERNTVVYTGTHDNDTTNGWAGHLSDGERWMLNRYLPHRGGDLAWDLMRLAWSSVADLALAPLQDVLSLGSEARMNSPGRPAGNWSWRFPEGALHDGVLDRLADLTDLYSRVPK
jgi:4-alpha-glucanotransferase